MAKNEIEIKLKLIQDGQSLTLTEKQVKKLGKQTDNLDRKRKKLTKTTDKYNRREKGVARLGMNSTKAFSKMQQGIDGGGGAGGLVRAYALLAANVFALTAAMGILSRAAQVDTLVESMTQLEIVSGKSIKGVARDLQEAAGFGLDFAAAMRSTSLAMSAGFGGEEIAQLGEVARNAAVSLGRNLPDALDRIFRGVIKIEPELLDEIGLFIRVNEASAKYASQLGIAVGDITEFQKRQAFMNEALEQGTKKFAAFAEVETDPFSLLGTAFADMTQGILTFINKGLGPVVSMLAKSKLLFGTVFAIVAFTLIKLAVPAMAAFTRKLAENASTAAANAKSERSRSTAMQQIAQKEHKAVLGREVEKQQALAKTAMARSQATAPVALGVRGKTKSRALEKALEKEVTLAGRKEIITRRIADLEKKQGLEKRMQSKDAVAELATLKAELAIHDEIALTEAEITANKIVQQVGDKSAANLAALNAQKKSILANSTANVAAAASTNGFRAAMAALRIELGTGIPTAAKKAGVSIGFMAKAMFAAKAGAVSLGIAAQTMWMRIMGPFSIFLLLLPVLQAFNRMLGVGSVEAEKLTEANTAAAEALHLLQPRLNHVKEALEEAAFGTTKFNEAQASLSQTILTSLDAIAEQEKAFKEYTANAKPWAKFWGETFPEAFGGGTANKIKKGRKEIIDSLKGGDLSAAMTDALKIYEDAQIKGKKGTSQNVFLVSEEDRKKAEDTVLALAKNEADAFTNVRSALDGARDSARSFADTLIVKTDVDKPLASFRQLFKTLDNIHLTEEKRRSLLMETIDDAAVMTMMTKAEHDALKDTTITEEERLKLVKDIRDRYFEQQQSIIRSKAELKAIQVLQKNIASIVKQSVVAVGIKFKAEERTRQILKEQLGFQVHNAIVASTVTREKLVELSAAGALEAYMETEEGKKKDISKIQQGINKLREEDNLLLQQSFDIATKEERKAIAIAKAKLYHIKLQEKLNKLSAAKLKIEMELATFGAGGPQKWQQMMLLIKAETANEETRKERLEAEKIIARANAKAQADEMRVLRDRERIFQGNWFLYDSAADRLEEGGELAAKAIQDAADNARKQLGMTLLAMTAKGVGEPGLGGGLGNMASLGALHTQAGKESNIVKGEAVITEAHLMAAAFNTMEESLMSVAETAQNLFGDDGIMLSAMATSMAGFTNLAQGVMAAFGDEGYIAQSTNKTAATVAVVAQAAADSIGMIMQLSAAKTQMAVKEIDNLINAEKKRDGKSKESVAKIAGLEKKKEMIKRKAFEDNKKMMLAQAIMSTAAAIAAAIAGPPPLPWSAVFGVMAAVMGAAQISIIKGMTYKGGSGTAPSAPQEISVGKRVHKIDVSRSPSAGELSYLRGEKGLGNAGNFIATGGAAGMIKNYATGGIIVGEQGPEMITPTGGGYAVTPNDALRAGGTTNANFTINAVDAAGVEEVLTNQRGNIISMIREAAHDHGEEFIEAVDTNAYGDASTSNTWTGKGGG